MNAPLPHDALASGPADGSVHPADVAESPSVRRERQQRQRV